MKRGNSLKSRLSSILFWSVVSAAFIGPGTVTTASNAGATYGYSLLWALIFSVLACAILQEAAARITLISGLSLGEAIAERYHDRKSFLIKLFIFLAILSGGIAYQAGNVLGAISGLQLLFDINIDVVTALISLISGLLLWLGNYRVISNLLGVIVAFMGFAFVLIALMSDLNWLALFKSSFIPTIPSGSEWLIIGLIGTTIVPYNLFLASGISRGQEIKTMRFGIISAIALGGIISIAILLAGTTIEGAFSFQSLKTMMEKKSGAAGGYLLGAGLFAAGLTSSVTAPLAAAITARSLFHKSDHRWQENKRFYKSTWFIVVLAGFLFGISGIKPVPAIILAQAINGLLLPFATVFLVIIVNDVKIIPRPSLNPPISNYLLLGVVTATSFLGLVNISKATGMLSGGPGNPLLAVLLSASAAITLLIFFIVRKVRTSKPNNSSPN